eukprot:scpid106619/ scgid6988/ 
MDARPPQRGQGPCFGRKSLLRALHANFHSTGLSTSGKSTGEPTTPAHRPILQVLTGISGGGKTRVALEYVSFIARCNRRALRRRYRLERTRILYPGGVYLLDLSTEETLKTSILAAKVYLRN